MTSDGQDPDPEDRASEGSCPACDVLRRADGVLEELTDRSVNSDRWMVGDEDCPPVLKLLDEFREEMLRFIPQRFDESKVILDTKLLKVREIVRHLNIQSNAAIDDRNSIEEQLRKARQEIENLRTCERDL